MRTNWMKFLLAAGVIGSLAGCVQPGSKAEVADSTLSTGQSAKPPADLAPGEQIDYAGHRCGNPNLHVKTHLCLFPRR